MATQTTLRDKVDNFVKSNQTNPPSYNLAKKVFEFINNNRSYTYDDADKDYWQMPFETTRRKTGDCDDWAGLTFYILNKLKFTNFRMGIFEYGENGHMSVIWFENDSKDPWVLDSTGAMTRQVIKMSQLVNWKLVASFDQKNEWKH